ncbi:hypothetical protein MTR_3g025425 [Medicago truncatula]|uniref:Uncharacterized protein n=1 Tax=Medicago truncatula TaxID=3880 RepID=A0A072UU30_MEDTR|nr:hypothetical protein MTR_3g025425 [Medicago truncatula]
MVPNEVAKSTVTVRRKRKRKNIVGGGEEQRSMTVRRGTKKTLLCTKGNLRKQTNYTTSTHDFH